MSKNRNRIHTKLASIKHTKEEYEAKKLVKMQGKAPTGLYKCTRCGQLKPKRLMMENKSRKDSVGSYCLVCLKSYKKEHYIIHKQEILAKKRAYYTEHIEELRDKAREYAAKIRQANKVIGIDESDCDLEPNQ